MTTLSVVVVGSANVDRSMVVKSLPVPGETVGNGQATSSIGGKGCNVAISAAMLGASVSMVAAVGDDPEGSAVLAELRAHGVDVDRVSIVSQHTGVALIVVDERGENQIAVAPGANGTLEVTEAMIAGADLVMSQLEVPVSAVLDAARFASGYFAVNLSPVIPIPKELTSRADLVVVNEGEFDAYGSLEECRAVIVTAGSAGASLYRSGVKTAQASAIRSDVINTVGAGDAFFAAASMALAVGAADDVALVAASIAASYAVKSPTSRPDIPGGTDLDVILARSQQLAQGSDLGGSSFVQLSVDSATAQD